MSTPDLPKAVLPVAQELSRDAARSLASTLSDFDSADGARQAVGRLATDRLRQLYESIVSSWDDAPGLSGRELAAALVAAQAAHENAVDREQVELIWTGPRGANSSLRRTDQALFEVVDRARSRLMLVTYAAYDVPQLSSRLQEATARGVEIRLVLESPSAEGGKVSFDPFLALRKSVPRAELYRWPPDERTDEGGRPGALHAKCAVSDGNLAFVSSANLTGSALESNMELGVLIEGADIPGQIERHFEGLIDAGVLQLWPSA